MTLVTKDTPNHFFITTSDEDLFVSNIQTIIEKKEDNCVPSNVCEVLFQEYPSENIETKDLILNKVNTEIANKGAGFVKYESIIKDIDIKKTEITKATSKQDPLFKIRVPLKVG